MVRVADIGFGQAFIRRGELYMRVKPVGFFLNSDLVADAINKNYVFAACLSDGKLRIVTDPDAKVDPMICHIIPEELEHE